MQRFFLAGALALSAIVASPAAVQARVQVSAPEESAALQLLPPVPAGGKTQLRILRTASNFRAGDDLATWSPTSKSLPEPIRRFAGRLIRRTSSIAAQLTRSAMRFIGTPYVFGGTTAAGFDCSGYVQHVFAMLGISLPRTADAQYDFGHAIAGMMRPGDLVFFQTYLPGPSHVGIYVGNGKFIHSSGQGVHVSALREPYWAERYLGAKRVVADI